MTDASPLAAIIIQMCKIYKEAFIFLSFTSHYGNRIIILSTRYCTQNFSFIEMYTLKEEKAFSPSFVYNFLVVISIVRVAGSQESNLYKTN
jgi:hypothetical protein